MPVGSFQVPTGTFLIFEETDMIRKFTLALALLSAMAVNAEDRSEAKMKDIAASKLHSIGVLPSYAKGEAGRHVAEAIDMPQMKIYKAEAGGFVIVSKDDRVRPVLAYSAATIHADNMPCCMKWWMNATGKAIAYALENGVDVTDDNLPTYTPVEPFVKCHWGQGAPYNNQAPMVGKKNAPSGCVATAMAQVIWHNRYPASAEFMGSFTEPGNNVVKKEPVKSTYNYDLMAEGYGTYTAFGEKVQREYSDEEGNAVAQLMHDCALASKMDFNTGASGAYSSDYGHSLHTFFGYPKNSIKLVQRMCFTDEEWHKMVYDELQLQSPLMYGGVGSDGGHCFVVHGMDTNGMVYVNWGWDGDFDGYFDMDIMNSQGNKYIFDQQQDMVIGIRPTARPDDKIVSFFASNGFVGEKFVRSFSISGAMYNFGAYDFHGKLGFRFVDEADGSEQYVDINWNNGDETQSISPWKGIQGGININPNTTTEVNLQPGHSYIVYPIAQCNEEIEDGRFSYVREFIKENVSGDKVWFRLTLDSSKKPTIEKFHGDIPVVTAIQNVPLSPAASQTAAYDLIGRRVADSYKGIVIRNGKKYIQ